MCRSMPEFFFLRHAEEFQLLLSENGRLVSSLARASVRGAFPAMIASTIGGASSANRRKRRMLDPFTLRVAAAAARLDPEDLMESFFDQEHYGTLAGEQELCSEYPDETQLD